MNCLRGWIWCGGIWVHIFHYRALLKCVENKRCSWRYFNSRVDVEKGTSKILKKKLYLKIEILKSTRMSL
jgi:hypothetical protein